MSRLLDLSTSSSLDIEGASVRSAVELPTDGITEGKVVSLRNTHASHPIRVVANGAVLCTILSGVKQRLRFSNGKWSLWVAPPAVSANLEAACKPHHKPHHKPKPKPKPHHKPSCHHHHHHHHHYCPPRDGRDGKPGKNGKDGKDGRSCCVREVCCYFDDPGTWSMPIITLQGDPLDREVRVDFLVVGAGGGGAPGSNQLSNNFYPGGAGGGSGETQSFFICIKKPATDILTVTIGEGGIGAVPGNTSGAGGDSYVTYNGKRYRVARGGKPGVSTIGGLGYPYAGGNARAPVADNGEGTDFGVGGATVNDSMGGGGGASTSYGSQQYQTGGNGGSKPTLPVQGYDGGGGGGGYGDADAPSAGANGGSGIVIVTYSYVEDCEPEPDPCDPCKPSKPGKTHDADKVCDDAADIEPEVILDGVETPLEGC